MGPNLEEYGYVCNSAEYVKKVPYPGAVRWPHITYTATPSDIRFKLKNLYSHLIFGAVLDMLARLAGAKPRQVDSYVQISQNPFATVSSDRVLYIINSFCFQGLEDLSQADLRNSSIRAVFVVCLYF